MKVRHGDQVWITFDGSTTSGVVTLASPNGESAILSFQAMLGGYVALMPILWDKSREGYIDLITRQPVGIRSYQAQSTDL